MFFSAPQLRRGPLGGATLWRPTLIIEVILKRFEAPDEVRRFPRGRLELVTIGGVTVSRATYEPGFKWSVDVGPSAGTSRCYLEHVGLVLQGRATVVFDGGRIWELNPGVLFHVPAEPHDLYVAGNEPYVSLHFVGDGYLSK